MTHGASGGFFGAALALLGEKDLESGLPLGSAVG